MLTAINSDDSESAPPFDALVSWYSQFCPVDVTRVGGSRLGRTLNMVRFYLLVEFQPIWKIYYIVKMDQNGFILPPKFGVKIPQIFELPPPSYTYIYIYIDLRQQIPNPPSPKIPWRFTEVSTKKHFRKGRCDSHWEVTVHCQPLTSIWRVRVTPLFLTGVCAWQFPSISQVCTPFLYKIWPFVAYHI